MLQLANFYHNVVSSGYEKSKGIAMGQRLVIGQNDRPVAVSINDGVITLRSMISRDTVGDLKGKWSYLEETFENESSLTEDEIQDQFEYLWASHQLDDSGEVSSPIDELQDAVCSLYEAFISLEAQLVSNK